MKEKQRDAFTRLKASSKKQNKMHKMDHSQLMSLVTACQGYEWIIPGNPVHDGQMERAVIESW